MQLGGSCTTSRSRHTRTTIGHTRTTIGHTRTTISNEIFKQHVASQNHNFDIAGSQIFPNMTILLTEPNKEDLAISEGILINYAT